VLAAKNMLSHPHPGPGVLFFIPRAPRSDRLFSGPKFLVLLDLQLAYKIDVLRAQFILRAVLLRAGGLLLIFFGL